MTKVVVNRCYGGFGLSEKAIERYFELKGQTLFKEADKYGSYHHYTRDPELYGDKGKYEYHWYDGDLERDDPVLVQVVEELGKEAAGAYAELDVVEVPEDVSWHIDEYDGREWVAEDHRRW